MQTRMQFTMKYLTTQVESERREELESRLRLWRRGLAAPRGRRWGLPLRSSLELDSQTLTSVQLQVALRTVRKRAGSYYSSQGVGRSYEPFRANEHWLVTSQKAQRTEITKRFFHFSIPEILCNLRYHRLRVSPQTCKYIEITAYPECL